MTSGTVPERHRELIPNRRLDWQRPFRDGRAIIKGTKDPAAAKSIYAKYIGS